MLSERTPPAVGTQNTIGITPPDSALLYVICSPVGPYYPDGFKPVALHGTTEHVRASPGGVPPFCLFSPSPPLRAVAVAALT